jgi:hypothetical protein
MEALSRAWCLNSSDIWALSHDIRSRTRCHWSPIVHGSHLITLSLELISRLILKLLTTIGTRADGLGFILLASTFNWFASLSSSDYSCHSFGVIYYKVIDVISIVAKLKGDDICLSCLNYLHRLLFIIYNYIRLTIFYFDLFFRILIVILNKIVTAFDHTLLLYYLLSNLLGALVLFLCLTR